MTSVESNISLSVIESIRKLVPNGNRLELPIKPFDNYLAVKETLVKAGAMYTDMGFDLPNDAHDFTGKLIGYDEEYLRVRHENYKTPSSLIARVIKYADISPTDRCFDPSAGTGAMLKALSNKCRGNAVGLDINESNVDRLESRGLIGFHGDFMSASIKEMGLFDRIVANPPSSFGQDVAHTRRMYDFLVSGGVMLSIVKSSFMESTRAEDVEFRTWLKIVDAEIIELEGRYDIQQVNDSVILYIDRI